MTTVGDGLFQYGGAPVAGGGMLGLIPGKIGQVFFVDWANGSDANPGTVSEPMKTLSTVHSKMTANRNDIAVMSGPHSSAGTGAFRESDTLTWSKNMCHLVGANTYHRIAHRNSIRATSGATTFTPLMSVTASGCVFANFHLFHGFAANSAQICLAETGERNSYFNVHIGGMGAQLAADHAGSRCITLTGDGERLFKGCTIGLDTVTRGAANSSVEFISAAVRDIFEDCLFLANLDAATPTWALATAAGSIDRWILFNNCIFMNSTEPGGGTAMTDGFNIAAIGGTILLKNCTAVGMTDWEGTAASGKVMIDGAPPTAATSGLAVDVAT